MNDVRHEMSLQDDIRREWHSRPISTITGLVTLVTVVAAVGMMYSDLRAEDRLYDRRLNIIESTLSERHVKISSHDVQIEVLKTELRNMSLKLTSIDSKIDDLTEDAHSRRKE